MSIIKRFVIISVSVLGLVSNLFIEILLMY